MYNFITITLKENSVPIFYLQMQIVQFMNMFIKRFLILLIKNVIGKMKDELKGKIFSEFVALK